MKKLKKVFSIILTVTYIFSCHIISFGAENNNIKIYINDVLLETDLEPQIIDGRVYVPARPIYEALDMEFTWHDDESGKYISSKKNDILLMLFTNKNYYIYYNQGDTVAHAVDIDASPILIDNRIFVPARYVAEPYGYSVNWNAEEKTVEINTKSSVSNDLKNYFQSEQNNKPANNNINYSEFNDIPDFGKVTNTSLYQKDTSLGYVTIYMYDKGTFNTNDIETYKQTLLNSGFKYNDELSTEYKGILTLTYYNTKHVVSIALTPAGDQFALGILVFDNESSSSQSYNKNYTVPRNSYDKKDDSEYDSDKEDNDYKYDNSKDYNTNNNYSGKTTTIRVYREGKGWVYEEVPVEDYYSNKNKSPEKVRVYKAGEGWVYVDADE